MEVLIENVTRTLKAGPPLRLAVLFGSYARGRNHPKSDVDIAILPCDSSLSLNLELDLAARLSRSVSRDVDLVRLDRASRNNAITSDHARELGTVASVRNRIAHGYASLDPGRLWSELPAGLDALERYVEAIARLADDAADS